MEWVAFVVSLAVITCAYVVLQFQRIEKDMMKKVDEFLRGYSVEYVDMSQLLKSDLQSKMHAVYQVHQDDFNKILHQTDRIKDLLHDIRSLTDTREKNENQIIALKVMLERCERKYNDLENPK
jgi:predicted nucleic acid-binding OB-fold protein